MSTSCLEILYEALAASIGVAVEVSDFERCQQQLYVARRESGDPELQRLQFRRSPYRPEQELWITKGKVSNGKAEGIL